jgi:hypothetical protein
MRIIMLVVLCLTAALAPASAQTPSTAPTPSAAPSPAATPADPVRTLLDRILRSGHADASLFSASFLAQIPADRVATIVSQLEDYLGAYKSIDGGNGDYTAYFAKGTDEVQIHLDAAGKIDGLLFKEPQLN